jgi:hypothetical protein
VEAQIQQADVWVMSSYREDTVSRGGRDSGDLMTEGRQFGGECLAQNPVVVTENQAHTLSPCAGAPGTGIPPGPLGCR